MTFRDRDQAGSRDWFATTSLANMQREMSRWIDDLVRVFPGSPVSVSKPRLDIHESEGELCIEADLPGITPSSVDVRIDGSTLMLSAERLEESDRSRLNYHVAERRQGFMQRTVRLPFTPDPERVRANYANGVLTVRIPKRGQQLPGRRIKVESSEPGSEQSPKAGAEFGAQTDASSGSASTLGEETKP